MKIRKGSPDDWNGSELNLSSFFNVALLMGISGLVAIMFLLKVLTLV